MFLWGHPISWPAKKKSAEEGALLFSLVKYPSHELCYYYSCNVWCNLTSWSTVCPANDMGEVAKQGLLLALAECSCLFWAHSPAAYNWRHSLFFITFVYCFQKHNSHIFNIGLAAWIVSPEHVIRQWSIYLALLILLKSCWEKDIPGCETFDQPSTHTYIISLAALYHRKVNFRIYIPEPSETMF